MEWPRGSGRLAEFPEVDRVEWLPLDRAFAKILPAQTPFLERLLHGPGRGVARRGRGRLAALIRPDSCRRPDPRPSPAHRGGITKILTTRRRIHRYDTDGPTKAGGAVRWNWLRDDVKGLAVALGAVALLGLTAATTLGGFSATVANTTNQFSSGTIQLKEGVGSTTCFSTGTGGGGSVTAANAGDLLEHRRPRGAPSTRCPEAPRSAPPSR